MATATINTATWAGIATSPQLKLRTHSLARPRGAFLAVELMLLALGLLQAAWGGNSLGTLIGMVPCALFYHVSNLDRSIVSSKPSQFWIDVLQSVVLGFLASAVLIYAFRGLVKRVDITLMSLLLIGLLPVFLRLSLRHLVNRGKFVEDVLIVGTGDLPGKLHRALGRGLIRSERNAPAPESLTNRSAAIDLSELDALLARNQISRVVIAEMNAQSRDRLAAALVHSRLRGLQVNDAVDFYEEVCGKIWVEALNPQWFVYTNGFNHSLTGACIKRCFDVTFALLLLVLSSPLLLLTAIAIKCDSEGPVLFRQVRVGLYGKTFVIYKFRSMRHDAELISGPAWATECDKRVTRVGRILRGFRLDEIPQALNVLKGDMSIVGPRPERPTFVDQLEREIPFYGLRHYLKPGITGWAQVMFRYGASVEDSYEKLQYDFYYAKHNSLHCDAAILVKTLRIVLLGRGR
jgi:sugar transferase (PEP-CTERM system associated)